MKKNTINICALALILLSVYGCSSNEDTVFLGNDCLNRTYDAVYVAGTEITLVYAMYMPYEKGKLVKANIQASIPGADGTYLENDAYSADDQGEDFATRVAEECYTVNGKSSVNFNVDTCAASLRYHYIIPEEAKGQNVTFSCSVTADNGESATYEIGPCYIRKMDMKLDIPINTSTRYISLETMEAYTLAQAEFLNYPIDLIWVNFKELGNSSTYYLNTFVSPTRTSSLPTSVSLTVPNCTLRDNCKMRAFTVLETQLARLEYGGVCIDDKDFEALTFYHDVDYVTTINAHNGFWIETNDGKYRAYIYVNTLATSRASCVISIKRYQMY